MQRLFRDPFLWGSLLFIVFFPAFDFYVLERNYYDSGSYFGLVFVGLMAWGLWFLWLLACVFVTIHRLRKWKWSDATPLTAAILVFFLNVFLGQNTLWQHYNFHKFHQARLDYARRGDGNWGNCRAGSGTWDSKSYPTLSIEKDKPEIFGTASGPYAYYRTFVGIPNGMWGFLYAPSLEDPIKALPQLNLEFALLWDREACVFLAGNW
jgi:hypothetical protein